MSVQNQDFLDYVSVTDKENATNQHPQFLSIHDRY